MRDVEGDLRKDSATGLTTRAIIKLDMGRDGFCVCCKQNPERGPRENVRSSKVLEAKTVRPRYFFGRQR